MYRHRRRRRGSTRGRAIVIFTQMQSAARCMRHFELIRQHERSRDERPDLWPPDRPAPPRRPRRERRADREEAADGRLPPARSALRTARSSFARTVVFGPDPSTARAPTPPQEASSGG